MAQLGGGEERGGLRSEGQSGAAMDEMEVHSLLLTSACSSAPVSSGLKSLHQSRRRLCSTMARKRGLGPAGEAPCRNPRAATPLTTQKRWTAPDM